MERSLPKQVPHLAFLQSDSRGILVDGAFLVSPNQSRGSNWQVRSRGSRVTKLLDLLICRKKDFVGLVLPNGELGRASHTGWGWGWLCYGYFYGITNHDNGIHLGKFDKSSILCIFFYLLSFISYQLTLLHCPIPFWKLSKQHSETGEPWVQDIA